MIGYIKDAIQSGLHQDFWGEDSLNRVQHDTWVRHRNETVLVVCQVCEPLTAQQVADLVARRLV